MRGKYIGLAAAAAALALRAPLVAHAEMPEGTREIGVAYETADSFKYTPVENDDRRFHLVAVRWSMSLASLEKLPGHSHLRWFIEPNAGSFDAPAPGAIVGLNTGLRYYPWTTGRLLPYLGVGGGLLYTWFDLIDNPFDFTVYPSVGLDVFLTPRLGLDAEYRMDHISNGGIRMPNIGLNSNLLSLGLVWRY